MKQVPKESNLAAIQRLGLQLPPVSASSNIKVSVLMITYNQAEFIAQAIESVLMQKTDFNFELIIGEDCSTDNTGEIVQRYQQNHPETIKLFRNQSNQGMMINFGKTLEKCTKKYVALIEGDDYWTSPYKLQTQIDFLEKHKECALCFHSVQCFYEDQSQKPYLFPVKDPSSSSVLKDLLKGNFISTCSVVFRNRLFSHIPGWYFQLKLGDWPLHILNAQHGKIGYIKTTMGKYRIHTGGVWSTKNKVKVAKNTSKMLHLIDAHLEYKYTNIISATNYKNFFYAAFSDRESSRRVSYYAKFCLQKPSLYFHLGTITLLRMFIFAYFPNLYKVREPKQ